MHSKKITRTNPTVHRRCGNVTALMRGCKARDAKHRGKRAALGIPNLKNGHIGILIGPRPCTHTNAAQLRAAKLLHQFRHQCFKVPHMLKQAIALAKAPFPLLNRKHRP